MTARSDKFSIGLIQQSCSNERQANVDAAIAGIRSAASSGAQIVCLQEIFANRYFCTVESSELFDLAESVPGPIVERMQEVAAELDVALIVPIFEKRSPGVYHNSAAVIDAGGEFLGAYRKMHIPDDPLYYEKFYFTPGDAEDGFKVFQTKFAKVGVLVCWDQWYPEAARLTALKGAEVIFFPTAIGWHPEEKKDFGEKQLSAWLSVQQSHAIANGVYVAAANRTGFEETAGTDGLEFFGNSFIGDPFGEIIERGPASEAAVLVAECSRSAIEDTRRNWPFLRDRRVDAYQQITSRIIDSTE